MVVWSVINMIIILMVAVCYIIWYVITYDDR